MRITRMSLAAILAAAPVLSGPVAAAEIYRWVDEDGVVNFTQLSPPDRRAQLIHTEAGRPTRSASEPAAIASATPAANSGQKPGALTPEQQLRLEQMQEAERARQAEIARIRSFNCERSRAVLQKLTAGPRIKVTGPDGEARIIPDDELRERIAKAQRGIAENCDDAG